MVTRVAVVVPVRDGETHLAAALDSVLAQTYADWQCVVVDDGSVDTSRRVAEGYATDDRFSVVSQPGAGVAAARNRGLREVAESVDHLSFLDADDVLLPDALARLVRELDAAPSAVGVYGTAEYVDDAGRPVAPGEHPARQRDRRRVHGLDLEPVPVDDAETGFDALVVSGPIWPPAVALVRADVVRAVGGFAEELDQCEDWDLYLRCSRRGPFVFVDRQVAWYRRHAANVTGRSERNAHLQHVVRCRAWASPANTPAQRRVAARAWRALQHRRVLGALRRSSSALVVAGVEAVQLLRVRPPHGTTGSPRGAPAGEPVVDPGPAPRADVLRSRDDDPPRAPARTSTER